MKTIKNLTIGIALGVLLATAGTLLPPLRSGARAQPAWMPVESAGERQAFTQGQLLQGSGLLWQIYSQGYRDGQASDRQALPVLVDSPGRAEQRDGSAR
jgi:hypothetical protein